jgi:hypothetical protein
VTRLLRAPLVHFLAIGGALLALRTWVGPRDAPPRQRIVIDAADVGRLRATWTAVHGAPPDAAAEATIVRDAVDEEMLYREAVARGFDRRDAAVQERLVRLGGFVGEDAGGREELEREARRLGLERSDLVVRRHLVEMMRLAAAWVGPESMPSDAELAQYLEQHADELTPPARTRLVHVYLSATAHGAATTTAAAAMLDQLRAAGAAPEDVAGRGDGFVGGSEVDGTDADLTRIFGPGFAAAVDAAPLRTWAGPVRSTYGAHLVWVRTREPGRIPSLATVRGRVLQLVLRERRERRAQDAMAAIRAGYDVEVQRP